eukprot:4522739-Prymnesium_polylepis.1
MSTYVVYAACAASKGPYPFPPRLRAAPLSESFAQSSDCLARAPRPYPFPCAASSVSCKYLGVPRGSLG